MSEVHRFFFFSQVHFLVWLCFPPAAAGRIDPVVLMHRHRFVFSKCQTSAFSPEGHKPNILQTSIRILRLSSPLPVVGPLVVRPGKKKKSQTAAGFYLRTCECLHPSRRLLILFFLLLRCFVFITRRRRLLFSSFFPFPSPIQSSRRDNGNVSLAIVSQPLSCLRPNPRTPPPPPLAALTQVASDPSRRTFCPPPLRFRGGGSPA